MIADKRGSLVKVVNGCLQEDNSFSDSSFEKLKTHRETRSGTGISNLTGSHRALSQSG